MLRIAFFGVLDTLTGRDEWELRAGLTEILPGLGWYEPVGENNVLAPDMSVEVCRSAESVLKIEPLPESDTATSETKAMRAYRLTCGDRSAFFRGVGLLLESPDNVTLGSQTINFTTRGVMLDVVGGNAAIRLPVLFAVCRMMALMGLNFLMLYSEDGYLIEGEPYFSYMRGHYTPTDLRRLDDYAHSLGIEVVPCIQTLAHLAKPLRWACYDDIRDSIDTLLVDDVRTYEFIEKMIRAQCGVFRSRRIHLGMDEAMQIGRGKYLDHNPLQPRLELFLRHLDKVLEIVHKLGLQPMQWSDMYFTANSPTHSYRDCTPPAPELCERVPQDIHLIYWDYYSDDLATYETMLKNHLALNPNLIFAGGIWNWLTAGLQWGKTRRTTDLALEACRRTGVREVFATTWGIFACGCPLPAILPGMQLYAEHSFGDRPTEEELARRFEFCTGLPFAGVVASEKIETVPGYDIHEIEAGCSSQLLFWQDPLLGLFDADIAGRDLNDYYTRVSEELTVFADLAEYGTQYEPNQVEASDISTTFRKIFPYYQKIAAFLSRKAELGIHLRRLYLADDREGLRDYAERILPELGEELRLIRQLQREMWTLWHRPEGWEIQDAHYGTLLLRLESTEYRLKIYLDGTVERLEELEWERLPYFIECLDKEIPFHLPPVWNWRKMVSASYTPGLC